MTDVPVAHGHHSGGIALLVRRAIDAMELIPYAVLGFAARVFPAAVFWMSGETKVQGFHLKDSAVALFENEYDLPLIDPNKPVAPFVTPFTGKNGVMYWLGTDTRGRDMRPRLERREEKRAKHRQLKRTDEAERPFP